MSHTVPTSYTYTEKKRIRKSFAKRASVLDVPFLLATQLNSYAEFLQAEVAVAKRNNQGLQSAFTSVFPIVSHNQFARLEYVSYQLGQPPFDVLECQQRGLTYASPLRAKVRLVIMDRKHRCEGRLQALIVALGNGDFGLQEFGVRIQLGCQKERDIENASALGKTLANAFFLGVGVGGRHGVGHKLSER